MDFSSLGALAADFASVRQRLPKAIADELEAQGTAIEGSAKSKFGGYQTGWAPLAESTKAERQRLGFAPDDPLFRSGGLRDAVGHKVEDSEGTYSSPSSRVPRRPTPLARRASGSTSRPVPSV